MCALSLHAALAPTVLAPFTGLLPPQKTALSAPLLGITTKMTAVMPPLILFKCLLKTYVFCEASSSTPHFPIPYCNEASKQAKVHKAETKAHCFPICLPFSPPFISQLFLPCKILGCKLPMAGTYPLAPSARMDGII